MEHSPDAAITAHIADAITKRGWSEREAAREFSLHRSTLRRRLDEGGWTITELLFVARVLGREVHALIAQAEASAMTAGAEAPRLEHQPDAPAVEGRIVRGARRTA